MARSATPSARIFSSDLVRPSAGIGPRSYEPASAGRQKREHQRAQPHVPSLSPLLPAEQILTLSIRECVDLYAERFELQARDLAVDLLRHGMNACLEARTVS